MDIITGYTGTPHITAENDRDINIGIFGSKSYVLQTGTMLTAEISNNNEIKVRDGVIMHQGCAASIKKNTYDSVTINNGSQGMKRIDLLVARYEKQPETNVESLTLKVLQGTPVETSPQVPEHTEGDIQVGDTVADMPLYEVEIDGLNITEIRKVFQTMGDLESVNGKITNGGKGYVRFPDGTQICYGTLSSTGYTSVNHNLFFAKPFIDTEYVVILTKGANGKFITEFGEYDSSGNRNRSVDKCSVHYDATTANYTKTISWVAIGRWK